MKELAKIFAICSLLVLMVCGCASNKGATTETETMGETPSPASSPIPSEKLAPSGTMTIIEEKKDSQIVTAQMQSNVLKEVMEMSIYLPPGYSSEKKYPVLYLFYGYGGTHDAWFKYLNMTGVADRLIEEGQIEPLIMVSPDYGNSFAVNSRVEDGNDPHSVNIGPYEDYLIQEVVPYIDANLSTDATREGRYIGGASMGGYASLYLGFNYPDLFSRIGAHSAALWNYTSTDQFIGQRDWLYANDTLRERRDPFKLAESQKLDNVQVYLDCGTGDALSEKDQALYELLVSKGIDAKWVPNPGGHDGSYWSSQLENYLLFYSGVETAG